MSDFATLERLWYDWLVARSAGDPAADALLTKAQALSASLSPEEKYAERTLRRLEHRTPHPIEGRPKTVVAELSETEGLTEAWVDASELNGSAGIGVVMIRDHISYEERYEPVPEVSCSTGAEVVAIGRAIDLADRASMLVIHSDSTSGIELLRTPSLERHRTRLGQTVLEVRAKMSARGNVRVTWLRGHAGDAFNTRADHLGRCARTRRPPTGLFDFMWRSRRSTRARTDDQTVYEAFDRELRVRPSSSFKVISAIEALLRAGGEIEIRRSSDHRVVDVKTLPDGHVLPGFFQLDQHTGARSARL